MNTNLLNRTKLWKKLAIMAIGLLAPALGFGYLYVADAQRSLAMAERESRGADYLQALTGVLAPLSRHRGLASAYLNGDTSFRANALAAEADIEKAIGAMDAVDAELGTSFGVSGKWARIRDDWHALSSRVLNLKTAEESYSLHSALLGQIDALADTVRDRSELSLDPILETYYVQNIAFGITPDMLDSLATLRGKATSAAAKKEVTPELRADMYAQRDVIPWHLDRMKNDIARLREADPALADTAGAAKQQLDAAVQSFTDLVYNRMLKSTDAGGITATTAFEAGDRASMALQSLAATLKTDLVRLLENRKSALARTRAIAIAVVLVALALGGLLAWVITRSITRPLEHAISTFSAISAGKYDNKIELTGTDEAGQVLQSLDTMQSKLRTQIETERAQAAVNSRLKSALDSSSACVAVADEKLDIIYVNQAAERLFQSAQEDFRQDLPSFNANRLIGANMDVFDKTSGAQRTLFSSLTSTHTADMRIGKRHMRLAATPVIVEGSGRIGTVVEWLDRTQECNAQEEVESIVKKAVEGDLATRLRLDDKSGFFAALGHGLNELLENMAGMVSKIQTAASEVHRGADEISQGNANLSQRTEEQSSSLEETASSMEEMTSTVKQNADNAGQANQLALAARDHAEKGGAVTGQAVHAMTEINESSKKIADIIRVIDELAFQTNLLALNAAVEAARAGEQGRGFAVVASEVRSLAGRSAKAAREIKELIEDSVKKIDEGSRLVNESGETLQHIVASVKKVSDIVAEIAAASIEQSSGIEQVNKAVMQMDQMTQQNAALVEEASAASHSMAEQARSLNQMMARYRLGDKQSSARAPRANVDATAPAQSVVRMASRANAR